MVDQEDISYEGQVGLHFSAHHSSISEVYVQLKFCLGLWEGPKISLNVSFALKLALDRG